MKSLTLLFVSILATSMASAQDAQTMAPKVQVVSSSQRIICSSDSRYKFLDDKGAVIAEQTENGKISESVRTTWAVDGVEYRSSVSTSFRDNGKTVRSKSASVTKFTTKTQNGLVIEATETTSNIQYLGAFPTGTGPVTQRKSTEETSYLVQGDERIIVSILEDGVASSYRGYEVTSQINDKIKQVKYVTQTPSVDVQDGITNVTVKEEITCTFETLD